MAQTVDQVLEIIGSFGRYQLRLIILANILGWFWFAWPLLLTTFIDSEPGWRCVKNNNGSECKANGTVNPGDKNFDLRCDIPRDEWEFVDDYTSVVTQVVIITPFSFTTELILRRNFFTSKILLDLSKKFLQRIQGNSEFLHKYCNALRALARTFAS